MATDANNLMIGAATVSIGDYVTAGGAGSLTDVGHTAEPCELSNALEVVDRSSERTLGVIATKITGQSISLVVPMLECTPEHARILMAQPASRLSGGTLLIGDASTQYHQIQLLVNETVATPYTSATVTLWRCQIAEIAPMRFAKGEWTTFRATFRVLRDDSVATADKYCKIVWA